MRAPRKIENGAKYHVIARTNRREFIMSSKGMNNLFLDVLGRAKGRYDFAVINFCILCAESDLYHPAGAANKRDDEDEGTEVFRLLVSRWT
jgi:hypothetical protein